MLSRGALGHTKNHVDCWKAETNEGVEILPTAFVRCTRVNLAHGGRLLEMGTKAKTACRNRKTGTNNKFGR
jgi:hypothetical protein